MPTCPNCGEINKENSKFCNQCGSKLNTKNHYQEDNSSNYSNYDLLEESRPAYGKISEIMADKLENSKLMDKFINTTSQKHLKHSDKLIMGLGYRKVFEYEEPEFLEVYDTIEDDFLKALFALEHNKFGADIIFNFAPTGHLSHEDSVRFYLQLLDKVKLELENEQQKEGFDAEEYYRKKYKETLVEGVSNLNVPRHWR